MSKLIDHIGHHVVKDEVELRRYPVTLTVEDGLTVFEVDRSEDGEWLDDVRIADLEGFYCTTCDTEVIE